MIQYSNIKTFWSNSSEDKPSREFLDSIEWINGEKENFIINPDIFGKATLVSSRTDISLVKFNEDIYIIDEKILLNNGLTKYKLDYDVWPISLSFLEQAKELFPVRSTNTKNYSAVLNDNRLDNIPRVFKPYQSLLLEPNSTTKTLKNVQVRYWNKDNITGDNSNVYATKPYGEYTLRSNTNSYSPGNIYFVFSSALPQFAIRGFSNGDIQSKNPPFDPFIAIPVFEDEALEYTGFDGGSAYEELLNNKYKFLSEWASGETSIPGWEPIGANQFIGVFKGPPFASVKTNTSDDSEKVPYSSFVYVNNINGGKQPLLFAFVGYKQFAELDYTKILVDSSTKGIDKYNNLILDGGLFKGKPYYQNKTFKIGVNFNGAGFYGYPNLPLTENYEDSVINYGSFLISAKDNYQNYITSNKNQINAGLRNTEQSSFQSIIGGAGLGGVVGAGGTTGAIVGAAGGLIRGIGAIGAAHRSNNAKLKDMRNNNSFTIQSSDISDSILADVFTNKGLNILTAPNWGSKYMLQFLDEKTELLFKSIIQLFGLPVSGNYTFKELLINNSNSFAYFELDRDLLEPKITSLPLDSTRKNIIMECLSYGIRVWKNGK